MKMQALHHVDATDTGGASYSECNRKKAIRCTDWPFVRSSTLD
jgi:hypothetical protein